MASNSQAGAASTAAASTAQQTFELANAITTLDPALDRIFHYNADEQRQILKEAPWRKDPHYFRRVRISAVALIKMVMHARSGGIYEVMGIMQGKIDPETRTIYVMDSYALPVQGTETRVSAANEAIEYMVQYSQLCETVGRVENAVGWYHSHPGYGCWLSGIDVDTQRNNQTHQDPFVAVVIDPNRTMSAGRVDIGAFRTYPEGYTPPADHAGGVGSGGGGGTSVPQSKIEDFGVHANQYYPLEVEHFKSTLDTQLLALLWNKYWVSTLSSSSLLSNRRYEVGQIRDVADQLVRARPLIPIRSTAVAGIPIQDAPLRGGSAATDSKDAAPAASTSTASTRSADGLTPSSPASPEKVRISDKGSGKAHVIAAGDQDASSDADPNMEGQADTHREAAEASSVIHKDRVESHLAAIKKLEAANKLTKVANDTQKITDEAEHGLLSTVLRDVLFNGHATGVPPPPPLS
ncbi:COP9 signalosome catalytic subunit rri1 [Tilletia horrida]|uniref:COP9 signalosome complex subunit 5 n=1 Tax=Tilletia horrida TaxID=155126 RepID=A0AAN6K075_9BASI|nr:COP9 signalosome catalytic subunit rri1 [Tilletia horrida]KAK0569401.1 COP9 signalosome catalytic subunit rri1 [Tilletia horrida]